MKLTDVITKVEAEIKTATKPAADLPTPEQAAEKVVAAQKAAEAEAEARAAKEASISPIIKMAIAQAEERRIKDLYHGFK